MPLVPQASHGRRGLLTQTSTPAHELLGQQHVVIAQKDHAALYFGTPGELHPLTDHFLPRLVSGMGLAGDQELDRALGVSQEANQALRIVQQQSGTFVSGKPPGETQGQSLGVQNLPGLGDLLRGGAGFGKLAGITFAGIFNQRVPGGLAHSP